MNLQEKILNKLKDPKYCRVRTVTSFIVLGKDTSKWEGVITKAAKCNYGLIGEYNNLNYEVQTLRIVTNSFGDYLDTSSIENASKGFEKIQKILNSLDTGNIRIRFAIGEARNSNELDMVPTLIQKFGDICNVCCNIDLDKNGIIDNDLTLKCASIVKKIGEITPNGEGNFNFCVNYNCPSYLPYFPPAYHIGENGDCFTIGFENPDLLARGLEMLNEELGDCSHNKKMDESFKLLHNLLQYHTEILSRVSEKYSEKTGVKFLGVDTSTAPTPESDSMTYIYKLLGVEYFGASGTLEISAFLTKVFKSIKNINKIGYCGLMLAAVEDTGLSQGTINNQYDIRTLLSNSAVCGIGLDTVPIPGNTSIEKISGLMRDTGTLAFRLNKPLMVRLFPVVGLKAGDMTKFETDDLCNCKVFNVF